MPIFDPNDLKVHEWLDREREEERRIEREKERQREAYRSSHNYAARQAEANSGYVTRHLTPEEDTRMRRQIRSRQKAQNAYKMGMLIGLAIFGICYWLNLPLGYAAAIGWIIASVLISLRTLTYFANFGVGAFLAIFPTSISGSLIAGGVVFAAGCIIDASLKNHRNRRDGVPV